MPEINLELIAYKMDTVEKKVDRLVGEVEKNFITQKEFEPYKRIIQGMIALILTAFMGALIALVIQSK